MRRRLVALLTTIATVVLAVLIANGITGEDTHTLTVKLGGHATQPAGVPAGPAKLTLKGPAIAELEAAKDTNAGGHIGADDETPPGVPTDVLENGARAQARAAKSDRVPDLTPLAAPSQPGCNTRLVGNYSSRNGVAPRLIVLHYTVSRNRPGRSDVDGITAYFNNRGSSASSNYVIDADGNCNYIVRETTKAWTQAAFNPWAISIEQVAYGDEPDYAKPAGYAKLGRVVRDAARRWHIPLRLGAVSGARVTRSGIIDHYRLGAPGGGHHDVNPFTSALGKVLAAARSSSTASSSPLVASERKLVRRRCYHRHEHLAGRKRTANLKWARYYRTRIAHRIAAIPGSRRHRPARRTLLERYRTGAAC